MECELDYRRARKGQPAYRGKQIPTPLFKRLWMDPSLTTTQIGRMLGIHKATVSQRAKSRGLPPREQVCGVIRPNRLIHDEDLAEAMLRFGVKLEDIRSHFGIGPDGLRAFRKRRGIPPGRRGKRTEDLPISAFWEHRAAQRMAASAAQTRAAFKAHERASQKLLRLPVED